MRCSLSWSQCGSFWRRSLVISGLALAALWVCALLSPVASLPGWVLTGLSLWAGLTIVQNLVWPEYHARRLHLALGLLLMWSVQEVQWGGWLMAHADWLAAGEPVKPPAHELLSLLQWQAMKLLQGHWVMTLLDQPTWRYWVAIPLCAGSLMFWRRHPVPKAIVRLATVCALLWMAMGAWLMARGLADWTGSAPWWFWLMLAVVLPFQFTGSSGWLAFAAWVFSVAVLVVKMVAAVMPGDTFWVIQALFGFTVLGTGVCWFVWWARLNCLKLQGEVYDRRRLETHLLEAGTLDDLFLPSAPT
jgi:hypothetical protein